MDLKGLLALAQQHLPHTRHSMLIQDEPKLNQPFVHMLLMLLYRSLPKLPQEAQVSASSMGLLSAIGASRDVDGYSKMSQLHRNALDTQGPAQASLSGDLILESRRIQWLMEFPHKIPNLRMDGNLLEFYTGAEITVAPAWLEPVDGVSRYVWEVMRTLYPTFSTAQLDMIVKSNTVEGTFALSGFLALALVSPYHFEVLRSRFKIHFENYFTAVVENLNEKGSDVREKFATAVVRTLHAEHPAFSENRLYSLAKYLSNIYRATGIDGLFSMCRYLLDKLEVQDAMAIGPDRNSEFYTRLADLLDANADALKKLVVYDVSAAIAFLDYDPVGAVHVPGVQLTMPQHGPVCVYLAGPPGTGKTTCAVAILRDLCTDGVRCIGKGRVLLVVVSTKIERLVLDALVANAGYTVINYEETRHLWDPSISRLDAILAAYSDPTVQYALIVTVHSLCKVLYSNSERTRARALYDQRTALGALRQDTMDLPHMNDRVAGAWFSEGLAIMTATTGTLVLDKEMTICALRRLACVPVVVVDGPVDQSAIAFWFDIAPNLRVHVLVPQQRPPNVVVFSELPPWLERLRETLTTPSAILLMTDRATAVDLFESAIRALSPTRDIFTCTADTQTFDMREADELLQRGAIIIASPVMAICQDLQARNVVLLFASFGGGPGSEGIKQMFFRVRSPDTRRYLFMQPLPNQLVCMAKPDPATVGELIKQIMPVVNSRANMQGAFFGDVASAVPIDINTLLHENEGAVIAAHLDEYLSGNLPLSLLSGVDFHRPIPMDQLARVVMNYNPDIAPCVSLMCHCNVRQGDSTSDRVVCSNCGVLEVVVLTGTTSHQPFRLSPLGSATKDFECGFFWKDDRQLTRIKGMPHLSPVDVAVIADVLRHGNQSDARRITELLSSLLASGANMSYVDGGPDCVGLPEALKTLCTALRNMASDKMRVAVGAVKGKENLIGLEQGDLLRQMLGANGDEKREFRAAIRVHGFMWALGLPWDTQTLDRLTMELSLVAWPDRFKKCQLWKKTDPYRQLETLSGMGDNLDRWLHAVYLMCVGVSAPARGIGDAQKLLDTLSCLRLSRLFTLFYRISNEDQTNRPLILSTRGLHIPHENTCLVVDLVGDRESAKSVLADVLSALAAFNLGGRIPRDPNLVTVKDAVTLAKLTAKFAFGMSLKYKKDRILKWNPAFLVTRLTVLYLRMRRDGPSLGGFDVTPENHAWLLRVVKGELECVDDTMAPLLAVCNVPKPSREIPRSTTVNSAASVPGSTQPYHEEGNDFINPLEKTALLAYMHGLIEKHKGLELFGTFGHCDELWSQLDAEQRTLVLGGAGDARAHLKLKLHLGKLALEILDRTKDSVLRRGFEKANKLMRQGTLDSIGSLDPGWARTGNVRESDLSSSESEDEEEQERLDKANERKRKRCRFLDDEAGQDDDGDLVSSSMETETYD